MAGARPWGCINMRIWPGELAGLWAILIVSDVAGPAHLDVGAGLRPARTEIRPTVTVTRCRE